MDNLCSDDDYLSIHDDFSSVRLFFGDSVKRTFSVDQFVTGMCVAVLGRKVNKTSPFHVLDVIFPQTPLCKPISTSNDSNKMEVDGGKKKYVGFMSGPLLAKPILIHQLYESLGDTDGIMGDGVSEICHLILCGNSISDTVSKVSKADRIFDTLAKLVSIDIVPSMKDLGTIMFPVEKPSMLFFPKCQFNKKVQACGSPYEVEIDDLKVMGTGGEPIDDIMRCTKLDSPLDAMVSFTLSILTSRW